MPEILDALERLGFSYSITTNGTLIDSAFVSLLSARKIERINLSIDGVGEENDVGRGIGVYSKAMHALRMLYDSGMRVNVMTTMTAAQLSKRGSVKRLFKEFPPGKRVSWTIRRETPGAFSVEQRRAVERIIQSAEVTLGVRIGRTDPVSMAEERLGCSGLVGCSAGTSMAYISASGDVYVCPYTRTRIGNIRNSTFTALWSKSQYVTQLSDRGNLVGYCGECKYRDACGGCRAEAEASGDGLLGSDPTCWLSRRKRK